MTAVVRFPTVEPEERAAFRASADELLNGLFEGYKLAAQDFRSNPTPAIWRELVHAHAAWKVAFAAEDGADQENR